MSVKAEDFYQIGCDTDCQSEIGRRRSASSMYYSLYHRCVGLVDGEILNKEGKGQHARLIDTLKEGYISSSNKREYLRLGLKLGQARDIRVHADYRLGEDFDDVEHKSMKKYVEDSLALVEELKEKAA